MNPDEPLRTKNLAEEDPAPMDDTLGGYPWLPRMIDKARAAQRRALGPYFKYPCPIDRECLARLATSAAAFGEIAEASQTGADLLRSLTLAGADLDALLTEFDPLALNSCLHADGRS